MAGKMKDAAAAVAIEEFFGLKPEVYSYLLDEYMEPKKAKRVNRNAVATISHNDFETDLLNKNLYFYF